MPLTAPLPFYCIFSSLSALSSILLSSFLFLTNLLAPLSSFQLLHPFNLYFPLYCSESSLLPYFQFLSISCQISLNKSQRGAVGPRNPGHGYPHSLSLVRASGSSMPLWETTFLWFLCQRVHMLLHMCGLYRTVSLIPTSSPPPTPLALLLPL